MQPAELLFGAATDPGQISAALASRFDVHTDAPVAARWTCLDTADWRLHRAGLTLYDTRHGTRRELRLDAADGESLPVRSSTRGWPRRVESLPPSPLRSRIAPVIGVRALLPLAEVEVRSLVLHLLDAERKTRVRVRVDQQRLAGDARAPLPLRVVVSPLRGYERDGARAAELLSAALSPLPDHGGAATVALAATGRQPGQPLVPPIRIDPNAPVAQSLAIILRHWLDVIESVRPGVLADVDIEFLHDLRTAVRATRSMLTLVGDLLPMSETPRFADDFAWLSGLTSPLRDLDVSLLEFDALAGDDPVETGALEPLRRQMLAERRRALRSVGSALESTRVTALLSEWRANLDKVELSELEGPATRRAAADRSRAAYRGVVKAATGVTADTPPDHLHRLRRRCKRMRYLLDSFGPVLSGQPHRDTLKALKALQDCLGDIQDVDVHKRQLADRAATLSRRGAPVETMLAIGALRERMGRRDAAAREVLVRRLARFCAPAMRARVAALGTVDA